MKQLFLVAILLISSSCLFSQTGNKQEIKFTQAWVWEYQNNMFPETDPGHKGEIVVYYEPKKNYWLFTTEAYGISGEMYNWILGKPDGTYILCDTDEFGKKTIMHEKLAFSKKKILPKHYQPTGKRKIFNNNNLGFSKVEGKEYEVGYMKTNDQSSIFVGDFKVDFLPLYFFNRLNIEAKLPLQFPVDFSKNKLLLQEVSTVNKVKLQLTFKEISQTEYYIDLKTE